MNVCYVMWSNIILSNIMWSNIMWSNIILSNIMWSNIILINIMWNNIMWKSVNLVLASCRLICPTAQRCRRTSNQGTLVPDSMSRSVCPQQPVHNWDSCKLTAGRN